MKRRKDKYKYIGVKCKTPGCNYNARSNGYCMGCANNMYQKIKYRKDKEKGMNG